MQEQLKPGVVHLILSYVSGRTSGDLFRLCPSKANGFDGPDDGPQLHHQEFVGVHHGVEAPRGAKFIDHAPIPEGAYARDSAHIPISEIGSWDASSVLRSTFQ